MAAAMSSAFKRWRIKREAKKLHSQQGSGDEARSSEDSRFSLSQNQLFRKEGIAQTPPVSREPSVFINETPTQPPPQLIRKDKAVEIPPASREQSFLTNKTQPSTQHVRKEEIAQLPPVSGERSVHTNDTQPPTQHRLEEKETVKKEQIVSSIVRSPASHRIEPKKEANTALKKDAIALLKNISVPDTPPEPRRPAQCVIICADLSFSLMSEQTALVKKAYKTIIKGLLSREMDTHLGVVVQHIIVEAERNMNPLREYDMHLLDHFVEAGQEDYTAAFSEARYMLSKFWSKHPGAPARVILLGDGHAETGYSIDDVWEFRDKGVPIHNIRVKTSFSKIKDKTLPMSKQTKGEEIIFSGNETVLLLDELLGPAETIEMVVRESQVQEEPKSQVEQESNERVAMLA